jgi:histidine triad (HIT) family protein
MSEKTLFQKIMGGEIPSEKVFEDDHLIGIRDISPQAPLHCLFIPRKPIPTINDLDAGDAELIGRLFLAARDFAKKEGVSEDGYRVVMNCNEHGGQSVYHIHLHLLGGRQLDWPPG